MQDKIGNLNEQIRTMKVSLENLKLENEDLKSEVKVHKFSIDSTLPVLHRASFLCNI